MSMELTGLRERFESEGFATVENFLTPDELKEMLSCSRELVSNFDPSECPVFSTDKNQKHQLKGDYFITSGDKVRFFLEEDAVDENGTLKVPLALSVNKIGHGLGELHDTFKKVTFSEKTNQVCKALGMEHPLLVQSMLIFKQPGIGGVVTPHQDSTFIHTEPLSCIGFWIALKDATVDNGCLWFLPKSHKDGIPKRFVRNPDPKADKKLIFHPDIETEYDPAKFVAAPVKAGTLVLIHGSVVHKSHYNASPESREAYAWHVVEKSAVYSHDNWLQRPENPFKALY